MNNIEVIYVNKGETKTIQLRTTGVLKQNKKGNTYRDLSNSKRKYHKLDNGEKQNCIGKHCLFCEKGNRPFSYFLIPILYKNNLCELLTNFSLHHLLAKYVSSIENAGQLPNLYHFEITKKETGFYNVKLIKPPIYKTPEEKIKEVFKDRYTYLTKPEEKQLLEFDKMLVEDEKYATETDWMDYMTKARCHGGMALDKTRAKFIYAKYITNNRIERGMIK